MQIVDPNVPLLGAKGMKKISLRRKGLLAIYYGSLSLTFLYSIVLFFAVSKTFNDIYLDANDDNNESPTPYKAAMTSITFILSICELITNTISLEPQAEKSNHIINNRLQSSSEHEELNEIKKTEKQTAERITRSCASTGLLWITRSIGYFSFGVGAASSMLGIAEFCPVIPITVTLGVIFTGLGVVYYHLLSGKDLTEHSNLIYSNLASPRQFLGIIYKNPSASLEIALQVLTNAFYRGLNFAFITASLLEYFRENSAAKNLGFLVVSAISALYTSIFTRLIGTKDKYLSERKNISWKEAFCKNYFYFHMLFSSIRTAGISYLLMRFLPLVNVAKIIITLCMNMILIPHNLFTARKISSPTLDVKQDLQKQNKEIGKTKNIFLSLLNLGARSLRIFAVMDFALAVQEFLNNNGANMNISLLDAGMISLAAVGIEANNYFYFNKKLKSNFLYYSGKIKKERKLAALNNEGFQARRFLARTEREYNEELAVKQEFNV